MTSKKLFITLLALIVALIPVGASACTSIYIGANLTVDGKALVSRDEDFSNDYNKLMFYNEHGKHAAGEEYAGCYGFTYTFTHDSYSYTSRRDDNVYDVCPDCGGTHEHTPYEAHGTNEMGVSVTATETLYGPDEIQNVDPYEDAGIEEAEITTVLLSEAATAREAIDLLTSIYDTAGCCDGAGIYIADTSEIWYIENISGHQYIALKLNPDMMFIEPNVSTIGLIDLDDTENVIASADVIKVAVEAGTFVGDAEANVIDFCASYNGNWGDKRIPAGLNYVNGVDTYTVENVQETDWCISNLDAEGNIVPLYTNIKPFTVFTITDALNYYKVETIGKPGNESLVFFQIDSSKEQPYATVEWATMEDARYNAFIPFYPLLNNAVAPCYQVATAEMEYVDAEPTEGDWYATTNRAGEAVWGVYPEGWKDSYYWCLDALSNLMEYGDVSEEDKAAVIAAWAEEQQSLIEAFDALNEQIAAAETVEAQTELNTAFFAEKSEEVHALALSLYETYSK